MGNKYTRAYYKCLGCGSLDKERYRGGNYPKHTYICKKCKTIQCANKVYEYGPSVKKELLKNG